MFSILQPSVLPLVHLFHSWDQYEPTAGSFSTPGASRLLKTLEEKTSQSFSNLSPVSSDFMTPSVPNNQTSLTNSPSGLLQPLTKLPPTPGNALLFHPSRQNLLLYVSIPRSVLIYICSLFILFLTPCVLFCFYFCWSFLPGHRCRGETVLQRFYLLKSLKGRKGKQNNPLSCLFSLLWWFLVDGS